LDRIRQIYKIGERRGDFDGINKIFPTQEAPKAGKKLAGGDSHRFSQDEGAT